MDEENLAKEFCGTLNLIYCKVWKIMTYWHHDVVTSSKIYILISPNFLPLSYNRFKFCGSGLGSDGLSRSLIWKKVTIKNSSPKTTQKGNLRRSSLTNLAFWYAYKNFFFAFLARWREEFTGKIENTWKIAWSMNYSILQHHCLVNMINFYLV